jgi:hypothetical protein
LKSGSLNLLEPSGPVKAFNGIALPFTLREEACNNHSLCVNLKYLHLNKAAEASFCRSGVLANVQTARFRSSNLGLGNQKDMKKNCALAGSCMRTEGLTCLSSIYGLNSLAYSGGQLCAGVFKVFTGSGYTGFSHRWLVSLISGGGILE